MVVVTVQPPTNRRLAPADPTVLPAIQRHVLLVNELQRGHMLRAALRGAWLAAGWALAFRLGVDDVAFDSVCDAAADPEGIAFHAAAFVFSTHGPERIVLITHQDDQLMAEAWEAGIVSVVSQQDPISTVLLAIMAAGLRVDKPHGSSHPSGISPTARTAHAPLPPDHRNPASKRCKTQ